MTDYWPCKAGVKFREQCDRRWPNRDHASDGWIGDASHQAAVSEHNPCWTCTGDRYGVVRAIDVDVDLSKADPNAMDRLVTQLVAACRDGREKRIWYIIFEGHIYSKTYGFVKNAYTGSDPHTSHMHISFDEDGDFNDHRFDLPIFVSATDRLTSALHDIRRQIENRLVPRKRKAARDLEAARRKAKSIRHDIDQHRETTS